jgi:hypothetical protein
MPVVVGIFPNNDAVAKLTDALKGAGFDPADLTVISSEEAAGPLITSGAQFILSGEAEESTIGGGEGIITGHGGQDIPGLTQLQTDVGATEEGPEEEALSDLNVPDGRTDDYLQAIESGRAVAGINTPDTDKAKALFSGAGATTVEVF